MSSATRMVQLVLFVAVISFALAGRPASAETIWVNNTGTCPGADQRFGTADDTSCTCVGDDVSDPGPKLPNHQQPLCSPTRAAAKTSATDTNVKIVVPKAFGRNNVGIYKLKRPIVETTVGTTWECVGCAAPQDLIIICCRSTTDSGWAITPTPGRRNIYQFSPGVRIYGLIELGLETDIHRMYPPKVGGDELNGSMPYRLWSDLNNSKAADAFVRWTGTVTVTGTTLTRYGPAMAFTEISGGTGAWWIGKYITIGGTTCTVAAVKSASELQLTNSNCSGLSGVATLEVFNGNRGKTCGSSVSCEPPSLSDCLDIIENHPGGFCQDDDDTGYGGSWVVYFHPRLSNTGIERDGTTLELHVSIDNSTTASFAAAKTTLSYMTFVVPTGGQQGDAEHSGPSTALLVGGSDSNFTNVWAWGGQIKVEAGAASAPDLSRFRLAHCLAFGLAGDNLTTSEIPGGFTIEDCEFIQKISTVGWEGPWGTATHPFVFRRNLVHSGGETRRELRVLPNGKYYFDLGAGKYNQALFENGAYSSNFATHMISFTNAKYVKIVQNDIYCNSDSMRLLRVVGPNVDVLNNILRCPIDTASIPPAGKAAIRLHNNVMWQRPAPHLIGSNDASEFASWGNNLILAWDTSCGSGADMCIGRWQDGSMFNLSKLRAVWGASAERNTIVLLHSLSTLNDLFRDPSVQTGANTGGDDYRPAPGSMLIDRGDTANCGYVPADGICDIGSHEDSDSGVGPQYRSGVRMWGEFVTLGEPGIPSRPSPTPTLSPPANLRITGQ